MLVESFLWRNRHKYSLIKRGAFWLVAPVFGNPVQLGIYEADQTLTLCEGVGAARLGYCMILVAHFPHVRLPYKLYGSEILWI